ncbi:hypothetical protein BG003_009557 [Podila horticola]|nr:hypothetical protein BG003_009557 [Podila horticola]
MSYTGDFICFAANKDAVYYVHTSKELKETGSIMTLAKSAQPPGSGLLGSSWTIVGTTTKTDILGENGGTDGHVDNTDCHVDENDTKLGYWSTAHLLQPSEAAESIGLLIQPENNASESTSGTRDIVTVYYGAENKMTTFQYAHIKSTGFNIEITERDLSQVQMPNPRGFVYKMAYGDGQMYVLLKGDNITPYDYARPAYNTTLSYFPLKAPFTLASPPASTISTPWFLDCEDTSTNTTVAAAANGKFYFVCPSYLSKRPYSRLYIFDSNTNQPTGSYGLSDYDKVLAIDLSTATMGATLVAEDISRSLPGHTSNGGRGGLGIGVGGGGSSWNTAKYMTQSDEATCTSSCSSDPSFVTILVIVVSIVTILAMAWLFIKIWRDRRKSVENVERGSSTTLRVLVPVRAEG